ncbi:hypothetical protein FHS96_002587 [Sphingomonas zeicaulis]
MEREGDKNDDIEFGAVSVETQGPSGLPVENGGRLPITGLSDD